MLRQFQLIETLREYLPEFDEAAFNRAYRLAQRAHAEQLRASGDPFFSHPFAVALIAANMRLDLPSVIAALLHDTIEDTGVAIESIRASFGSEIASLVDGVTKLDKIQFSSKQVYKAENFRKFMLAIVKDIRVLLIKLCDRLHNMRTLHHIADPEKRKVIATETLEIFAILAGRMGLHNVQDELEDLAFLELFPEEHARITQQIENFARGDAHIVEEVIQNLEEIFQDSGLFPKIIGRHKTPYSIWSKLQQRRIQFEQLTDVIAFRIIVPNIDGCYRSLGIVHTHFPMIPGTFKDYISTPKANGYKSLHTSILGPFQRPIEIQIRTIEMDDTAQHGCCSHWAYKKGKLANRLEAEQYRWLKGVLSVFETASTPEEILRGARLEMFRGDVFCFTPQGDLISLPTGATVVDFAYAIHTSLGDTCIGARINGQMCPLRTVLKNGEQIEVITSPHQHPSALWEQFVVTGKAKSRIRQFVHAQEKTEFIKLGQALLKQAFSAFPDTLHRELMELLLRRSGYTAQRTFQEAVGRGQLSLAFVHAEIRGAQLSTLEEVRVFPIQVFDFVPGIALHHAECCRPVSPYPLVGQISPEKGLVVHTKGCPQLELKPYPLVDIVWKRRPREKKGEIAKLLITFMNQPGTFSEVTSILRKKNAHILDLKLLSRALEFFDMHVEFRVENEDVLKDLMVVLRECPRVQAVRLDEDCALGN